MRADDLVHVVIRLKLYLRDLTPPLVTNEQSYLREEPIQGRSSLENPEEQEHWVLTRRGTGSALGSRVPKTSPAHPTSPASEVRSAGPILCEQNRDQTAIAVILRALLG